MAKRLLFAFVLSVVLSIVLAKIFIPQLKKMKAGQTILCYLKEHFSKSGTPTMGGLFFVGSAVVSFFVFKNGNALLAEVALLICVCYAVVGFLDDFIKIKFCQNQGLTPFQKMLFQFFVALLSGIFCYRMGLDKIFIPYTRRLVETGIWIIPISIFVFIATTNAVNLCDGLDALCGTTSKTAFIFTALLIFLQTSAMPKVYVDKSEYQNLILLLTAFVGALDGFLLFNTNRASVFMGDTGSLALGGLFASVMIFSSNLLYIPIMGIMFVLSGISVILQVIYYKKTGKRLFLMAPLHHHFQHLGYGEPKIVFGYKIVTVLFSLTAIFVFIG
ncbi:MAG: phospho-N-acetylmuramoyl-pentapeptide-transferase [Christensenellaceae bacterium]